MRRRFSHYHRIADNSGCQKHLTFSFDLVSGQTKIATTTCSTQGVTNLTRQTEGGTLLGDFPEKCTALRPIFHHIPYTATVLRGQKLNNHHAMALNFYACYGIMTEGFWVGGCAAIVGVFFSFLPLLGHAMQMEKPEFSASR